MNIQTQKERIHIHIGLAILTSIIMGVISKLLIGINVGVPLMIYFIISIFLIENRRYKPTN